MTLLAVAALTLAGCGLQPASNAIPKAEPGSVVPITSVEDPEIVITSKPFTEQIILGKIAVILADVAGYEVSDLTSVPGSQPARKLIESNQANMVWEYTGTAWLTYLGHETPVTGSEKAQWEAVRDEDAANGIYWGTPAPLNNTYALAMNEETTERLGITKLSELKDLDAKDLTFCVDPEFNSRRDGLTPMFETYGLQRGSDVPERNIGLYDVGAIYSATADGACNFGEVFTTDGRIKALNLTVLEDDRKYFPNYNIAPVFNAEFADQNPELVELFNSISPMLDDETMQDLNYEVDVEGREPTDVAYEWMVEQGLIKEPGA